VHREVVRSSLLIKLTHITITDWTDQIDLLTKPFQSLMVWSYAWSNKLKLADLTVSIVDGLVLCVIK